MGKEGARWEGRRKEGRKEGDIELCFVLRTLGLETSMWRMWHAAGILNMNVV